MFPDVRVHTPYPIQFGGDDWITVVTNATGTFTGEMTLPDGKVVPPTGKALDLEFAQTSKWEGDQLIVISAFWDSGYSEAADRPRLAAKYAGRIAGTTVLGSAQLPARGVQRANPEIMEDGARRAGPARATPASADKAGVASPLVTTAQGDR